jgi:hypothetical protein
LDRREAILQTDNRIRAQGPSGILFGDAALTQLLDRLVPGEL